MSCRIGLAQPHRRVYQRGANNAALREWLSRGGRWRIVDRELQVTSGAVIAYRLFDVAYAIDLPAAERLWAQRAQSSSTRGRLSTTPPKAVAFGVPPVEVAMDPVSLSLGGTVSSAQVTARLFDFGVVTFAMRVAADANPWSDFVDLMNMVDETAGPSP